MPAPPASSGRFQPHAAREMASMFDDVSGRYDLINRLMTLGQDGAWRAAMAHAVPSRARVVLDLCTGSGVSLAGLTRPGRLVIGADVSLRMLSAAADRFGGPGWAPRLVCGDAFRLPLSPGSVDAVTIGFGMRNLRPRATALAELSRVLAPGGTLVVLEACAPGHGAFAPIHRLHLRYGVPLLGRLSADPSAYVYLRDSIFEFGDGREFDRDLAAAGYSIERRQSFLFGATQMWVARTGESAQSSLQPARGGALKRGELPHRGRAADGEWTLWSGVQLVVAWTLFAALVIGLIRFAGAAKVLPLEPWQKWALGILLALGAVFFGVRSLILTLRRDTPRPPR